MSKPNGYVLHSDSIRVVIATGFKRKTKNPKTGNMIQLWIIRRDIDPLEAIVTGKDQAICGNCPLRGNKGKARACYVAVKNAPLQVFRAFKRGNYPRLTDFSVFNGLAVRFGAYGDPVHIPLTIIREIASRSSNWTGYSHQWRNPLFAGYREFVMASVERPEDVDVAHGQGWRTFRVAKDVGSLTASEIVCVNESRGVTCEACGLCKGSTLRAKSIAITVHGIGASSFGKN